MQTSSIPILTLFRSTTEINKNSLLTRSISHLVPKIFCFFKNANEILYDVIYSTNSVKEEYLIKTNQTFNCSKSTILF